MNDKWLIWSIEHNSWWKPGGRGYTIYRELAGEYGFTEACEIVAQANIPLDARPNEAMVKVN
jgi:hypothetical protein